jgi:hypothetical protein
MPSAPQRIARHSKLELREAAWPKPNHAWCTRGMRPSFCSLEVFHNGEVGADTAVVFPLWAWRIVLFEPVRRDEWTGNRVERSVLMKVCPALRRDPTLRLRGAGHRTLCPARWSVWHRRPLRTGGENPQGRQPDGTRAAHLQPRYHHQEPRRTGAPLPRRADRPRPNGRGAGAGSDRDTQTLKLALVPPSQGTQEPRPGNGPAGCRTANRPRRHEDRLARSKSRNLLKSIDDKLRRQKLGN